MKEYAVFIEKTGAGYGASVPDLPGCVASGPTLESTIELISEGIDFHIEGLKLAGVDVPEPTTYAIQVRAA